ncbi:hypothetical protein R4282_19460 [Rhodococcus oxybenzonivorans]|uniref:hypothetical protein n=1 Tax=Rhodococcus oxybenzonivorans TaxID=1990687 RepID=UPI002953AE2B|nr:hypothetical protein [Rhodococcus oxybenzonivorans]MDV7355176.1 hypothetical protein [Rhodococcus oxybenzonivorans]
MQIVEIEYVPDRCPTQRSRQAISPRDHRIIQCRKGNGDGIDQSMLRKLEICGRWVDTGGPSCEFTHADDA